jgi:hypothetical protein
MTVGRAADRARVDTMNGGTGASTTPDSRRATRRVKAYCPAEVWGTFEDPGALCLNISCGGMALAVTSPLPVGTLLRVSTVLPNGGPIEVTGEVIWTRSLAHEPRVGVRYLALDHGAYRSLSSFVERSAPS